MSIFEQFTLNLAVSNPEKPPNPTCKIRVDAYKYIHTLEVGYNNLYFGVPFT